MLQDEKTSARLFDSEGRVLLPFHGRWKGHPEVVVDVKARSPGHAKSILFDLVKEAGYRPRYRDFHVRRGLSDGLPWRVGPKERKALSTREAILKVMARARGRGKLETTILREVEKLVDADFGVGLRTVWPEEGERDVVDELVALVDEGVLAWNPDDQEVPGDRPLTYRLVTPVVEA